MIQKDQHSARRRDSQGWRRNENDIANEKRVADYLSQKWGVKFHGFAKGSPVDYWVERRGVVSGIAELKTSFKKTNFAFLSMRKFIAIESISRAFGCAGLYLHLQPDGKIYWGKIGDLRGTTEIVGQAGRFKNSREPILKIPLKNLTAA